MPSSVHHAYLSQCISQIDLESQLSHKTVDLEIPPAILGTPRTAVLRIYLTQSVFEIVSQKSIPTQIRQLILFISYSKDKLTGVWGS